jgi:hypothetical protein
MKKKRSRCESVELRSFVVRARQCTGLLRSKCVCLRRLDDEPEMRAGWLRFRRERAKCDLEF